VLVGMMGAGKTTVGRRLAARLGLEFVDADAEIERAAGCSIPEIFERHGEAHFRDGERRVIARLVEEPVVRVLATGGGAFNDERTRATVGEHGISIWLKADLDLLLKRVSRRNNRPLLKTANPRATLAGLLEARNPIYALAHVHVETTEAPPEAIVDRVLDAVQAHVAQEPSVTPPDSTPVRGAAE
jgi:shikimate kinase